MSNDGKAILVIISTLVLGLGFIWLTTPSPDRVQFGQYVGYISSIESRDKVYSIEMRPDKSSSTERTFCLTSSFATDADNYQWWNSRLQVIYEDISSFKGLKCPEGVRNVVTAINPTK